MHLKRFSYAERDYAFGQRLLTLRTTIGLTQAGLAQHLASRAKRSEGGRPARVIPKLNISKS